MAGLLNRGQDQVPNIGTYCEPCYAPPNVQVKPLAGHCQNCDEDLCRECFIFHNWHRLFRGSKLVKGAPRPILQPTIGTWLMNLFYNMVREYMPIVAIILVPIILAFVYFHQNEGSVKIEQVNANCDIVMKQHDKVTTQLETLTFRDNDSENDEKLKAILTDLQQLAKLSCPGLPVVSKANHKLNHDHKSDVSKADHKSDVSKADHKSDVSEANHESDVSKADHKPDVSKADHKSDVSKADHKSDVSEADHKSDVNKAVHITDVSKAKQRVKRPIFVKNITVTASSEKPFYLHGSLVLPNKQVLITDWDNRKLKLIDTNRDKIISELNVSGCPFAITKIKADEVAVTANAPNTIQFISVSQNVMSNVREVTVDGWSRGIVYNDRDQTLIVTFVYPPKVKILDMKGNEIKCIEHDSMGDKLFSWPYGVALTPDMTNIYVTDYTNNSVTRLSLNGDVEAVYDDKTKTLNRPKGVYVHTSGLVYVVGGWSHTVHELDPESGEFKVVLEEKDGLFNPLSISYCEIEDKMYIGMSLSKVLKVFKMK